MRAHVIGPIPNSCLKLRDRFGHLILLRVRRSQIEMCFRVRWLQAQGLAKLPDGVIGATGHAVEAAQVVMRICVIRIQGDGLERVRQGFGGAVGIGQDRGEAVVRFGAGWIPLEGDAVLCFGPIYLTLLTMDSAHVDVGFGQLWIEPKGFGDMRQRFLDAAGREERFTQIILRLRVLRAEADCFLKMRDCLGAAAGVAQGGAKVIVRDVVALGRGKRVFKKARAVAPGPGLDDGGREDRARPGGNGNG